MLETVVDVGVLKNEAFSSIASFSLLASFFLPKLNLEKYRKFKKNGLFLMKKMLETKQVLYL